MSEINEKIIDTCAEEAGHFIKEMQEVVEVMLNTEETLHARNLAHSRMTSMLMFAESTQRIFTSLVKVGAEMNREEFKLDAVECGWLDNDTDPFSFFETKETT